MKRRCICFLLWILVIALSYGGGYLCFAWPISGASVEKMPEIIPVTAGKENFILPETRLVVETINLKTGEKVTEEKSMPSVYLGLEREELSDKLNKYMDEMPVKEMEQGLVSYGVESYSTKKVVLKKIYYPDENYKKYYILYRQGRIVVYYSDRKTVLEYPDIHFRELPLNLQCELLSGKEIKDDEELYAFLQNYSS
ncbi:MAG: hypothetical protein EOM34_08285 [Clostridia bacterium]|nr:hypothetical protein [Lachnospiraceae bacterium]NCC00666.1 hypothetical protein [Clostridia bacterium]NCD02678.1 hypothetical protein [Clostridia bacterium]